jgi:hypothetical protein
MAAKLKVDELESVDGSTNLILNNSVTMASGKTLPAASLTGNLPAISAANLTAIPAGNLTGTVADARISALTASKLTGALPAISGANLTGVTSVGGATGADFNDNTKLRWGTGNDLEIYHDGSHSYIADTGTGNLKLISNGTAISIEKYDGENMAIFRADGAVDLYHNDSKKFETTSTGVTVTGAIAGASNLGKILQVVQGRRTGTATYSVSQTWTAIGSGSNGLNLDITPSATTSKILLTCHINLSNQSGQRGGLSFFRGSTMIGQGDGNGNKTAAGTFFVGVSNDNGQQGFSMQYLDSPSTTSSTTYTVKFFMENATNVVINEGHGSSNDASHFQGASSITAMEIGV